MIGPPTDEVLRYILESRHGKRLPKDWHFHIAFEHWPMLSIYDTVRIRLSRIKGVGLRAPDRHAIRDVPYRVIASNDKGSIVNVLAEAIDELVRLVMRPDLPTFRIRRDARYGTHKRDAPTKRLASRPRRTR